MQCPVCQYKEIGDEAKVCPKCQSDLVAVKALNSVEKRLKRQSNTITALGILAGIFLLLLIGAIVFLPLGEKKTDSSEVVITKVESDSLQMANSQLQESNATLNQRVQNLEAQLKECREEPKTMEYTVRDGDNLWDLADRYYNNPWEYVDIAAYNNIRNPNLILTGQELQIPKK